MQLRVADQSDMLSPSIQPEDEISDNTENGPLAEIFSPSIEEDNSPSLIQSLTGELDRWKHHCHVLGNELKHQREQITPEIVPQLLSAADDIDELTDIRGIGAVLARKLHEVGIFRFKELANLDDEDLERAQVLIPDLARRMKRDDWIDQAHSLYQRKHQSTL